MLTDQGYLPRGSQKVNLGYVLACGIDRLGYGSARELGAAAWLSDSPYL